MFTHQLIIWIIISASALFLDIITSAFLFVWFAFGGVAAIVAYSLGYPVPIQVIVFAIVSVILLSIGYPIIRKIIKKTTVKTPTMEQNYIGTKFIAEKDIKDKTEMKIGGIYWTVINIGDLIKEGDSVRIEGIEGNKFIIKKIEEENKL